MFKKKKSKIFLSWVLVAAFVWTAMPANLQAAVKKTVKSVSVNKSSFTLKPGNTASVKVTVKAVKKVSAKDLKIKVKSSNKKVAVVKVTKAPKKKAKSGASTIQITAKGEGTAKITVTSLGANKKGKKVNKSITVNVTKSGVPVSPKPTDPAKPSDPAKPTDPTKPTDPSKPTDPIKPSDPAKSGDFEIRSDIGGTDSSIKLTKDIRLAILSIYAGTLPTKDTITKYVWFKDGKEITKQSLKYDTAVNASRIEVVEPGDYSLKITTSHSSYNPDTLKNEVTEKEYTSNVISVGTELEKPATDQVKWTTEVKTIEKQWAYKDEETGENFLYPIVLKRELVSFDPWPTTVEQVEYVIKNCNDPFVIGALYVVALDNYNFVAGQSNIAKRGITSMVMTNALATGAFIEGLDLTTLGVQPSEKSTIQTGGYNDLGILAPTGGAFSGIATSDKENGYVYQYAPRTYCEGATNENGYAPNGNPADIHDKTKWKIVVDQYPYCFDQVVGESYGDVDPVVKKEGNCEYQVTDKAGKTETRTDAWSNMPALHKDPKFITVCPEHFQLESDKGDGKLIKNDANQLIRAGLVWSEKSKRWVAADYAAMNGFTHEKQGLPTHYNYQGQGLFSNSYVAPAAKSGF